MTVFLERHKILKDAVSFGFSHDSQHDHARNESVFANPKHTVDSLVEESSGLTIPISRSGVTHSLRTLESPQTCIYTIETQQLLMTSSLGNLTIVEYNDLIGIAYR